MADTLTAGGYTGNPLYKEVKIRITRNLAAGAWKPGEAIPSESRLAEQFNVSIGTIRKAIDELVAERILVRHQGRGTFVARHTDDRTLFYFFHMVGKDGSRVLPVMDLLSFRASKAGAVEEALLGLNRGAPTFRIRNLLKLSGKPVIHDEIIVSARLFSGLTEEQFALREGTIYALYQARWGINVVRINERLSAGCPPAAIAPLIGMRATAPALAIKRVAYTYHDVPVEYRVSWVNTEEHEYLSDLWKGHEAG
ncbi:MAG TPA: GntR family transcriptional regulator [Burkholderiales bacterium]|nr:GntR family transcriptional regulator [Burkholderiales bacterium]